MLDEPLDSLDLPSQASVAALIARICREQQVTVMLVAHDVNPILPYLDCVGYIAAGQRGVRPAGGGHHLADADRAVPDADRGPARLGRQACGGW